MLIRMSQCLQENIAEQLNWENVFIFNTVSAMVMCVLRQPRMRLLCRGRTRGRDEGRIQGRGPWPVSSACGMFYLVLYILDH